MNTTQETTTAAMGNILGTDRLPMQIKSVRKLGPNEIMQKGTDIYIGEKTAMPVTGLRGSAVHTISPTASIYRIELAPAPEPATPTLAANEELNREWFEAKGFTWTDDCYHGSGKEPEWEASKVYASFDSSGDEVLLIRKSETMLCCGKTYWCSMRHCTTQQHVLDLLAVLSTDDPHAANHDGIRQSTAPKEGEVRGANLGEIPRPEITAGKGWRRLREKEPLEAGDNFLHEDDLTQGPWCQIPMAWIGSTIANMLFRRRVPAAPVEERPSVIKNAETLAKRIDELTEENRVLRLQVTKLKEQRQKLADYMSDRGFLTGGVTLSESVKAAIDACDTAGKENTDLRAQLAARQEPKWESDWSKLPQEKCAGWLLLDGKVCVVQFNASRNGDLGAFLHVWAIAGEQPFRNTTEYLRTKGYKFALITQQPPTPAMIQSEEPPAAPAEKRYTYEEFMETYFPRKKYEGMTPQEIGRAIVKEAIAEARS